jgi:hypothetical protein
MMSLPVVTSSGSSAEWRALMSFRCAPILSASEVNIEYRSRNSLAQSLWFHRHGCERNRRQQRRRGSQQKERTPADSSRHQPAADERADN